MALARGLRLPTHIRLPEKITSIGACQFPLATGRSLVVPSGRLTELTRMMIDQSG